jgi:hypothetical protein
MDGEGRELGNAEGRMKNEETAGAVRTLAEVGAEGSDRGVKRVEETL